ncbi:hypothetical protein BaRGS_00038938, partial [Batillaria attramentaria]
MASGARLVLLSVLYVLVTHLLLQLVVSPTTSGEIEEIECTALIRQQSGLLTCFYKHDVSATKEDIIVRRLPKNESSSDPSGRPPVLGCSWLEDESLECIAEPGYHQTGPVSEQLSVIIPHPTLAHEGNYICILVASDSKPRPCYLAVATRPEPPYNLTIDNTTQHNITVSWTGGKSGLVILPQTFRVRYKKTTVKGPYYKYEDVYPNGTTYTITDLRPDTTYEISVMASNSRGDSDYQ